MTFQGLNERQQEAVKATEGPVLILAGAGAGKTKTITERIHHLIASGTRPSSILAITFTNKAAKEMKERVEVSLSGDPSLNRPVTSLERPFISTFHSLGVYILREQGMHLGLRRHFKILDKDDSKKCVKEALVKVGLDPKTHDPGKILGIISKEKGRGVTMNEYNERNERGYFSEVVRSVWKFYESSLREEHGLDFDDLLLKTRDLLRDKPEVRKYYRDKWQYIHVDEYQDTNKVQYDITKLLVGESKNICVVGDIDQNIYSWRGADIQNILAFEKDYENAKVILLEENYRSTKTILEAANTIIAKNKLRREKNLFTGNPAGDKISLYPGYDEVSEAEFISDKALSLIKGGTSPSKIAVLYRANFQSRVLEESFMQKNIPYQLLGTKFFERKEIKDILSYIRAALNQDALSDMKRIVNVPARGIGKATIVKIFAGGEADLPGGMKKKLADFRALLSKIGSNIQERRPSEVVASVIKESGMEAEWKVGSDEDLARLENAYELVSFAARYDDAEREEGILNFLSDAALQSDQDEMKEEKESVRLMTVHSSKGLEFDTVFISGLEEGLFPHKKITQEGISSEEAEEERRLFYVALTRARKKVYLTYAQVRLIFGRREINIPSEFIFDIPEEYLEPETYEEAGIPRKPLLDIDF